MIGEIITDKSEVGFYEQAQKVIRLSLTIVSSLGIVMVPRMANTFASGDKEKINRYLKNSFAFVFFLGFPVTFGIVSIAEAFVPEFFGPGYDNIYYKSNYTTNGNSKCYWNTILIANKKAERIYNICYYGSNC